VISRASKGGEQWVDVRSPEEFRGELLAPPHLPQEQAQVPGHIPGASNITWSKAAREDGTINAVSANYDFVRRSPPVKTREQVRSELAVARASGEYAAANSEAHAFANGAARTPAYARAGSRKVQ
jgi:3-mercaptopyruvate sulfurtransferase SseA